MESLFLNSIGVSVDSNIYTKDIILKTNFFGPIGSIDIYQSLINLLSKEKTDGNINDFQTLAYDWRLLPSNILSSGIKTDSYTVMLKDKIKDMAKKSPSGKVIIIAHSYGGLLAKSLLEDLEKEGSEDLIESVSLVSVPEYGTPQSIPSIFYGDNQDLLGGLILSKTTAMGLGRNMLSAHLLLPSSLYFSNSDDVYNQKNIINFDNWVASRLASGGEVIDSQGEMVDFLKNKNIISKNFNVNSFVFDKATAEHDLIDNYSSNLSSKTYSILAVGIPTLSGLTYVRPRCRGLFYCSPTSIGSPDFTRKYSLMGDGVVIAHNLATRSGSVFTVDVGKENEVKKTASMFFREDPIAHKDVFRSSGVRDILHAILSRSKQESQSINSFSALVNPYVSYVSGVLSKPGPILGSYGDSSVLAGVLAGILPGILKINEGATDSDFVERFNNSKVLVAEAYGPVVLKTNYQSIADLQNKPFDQLNLENRIVNYTNYSDGNRVGVVSVVPVVSGGGGSGSGGGNINFGGLSGTNIFAQGSGVGIAQIVTKIDDTEIIYPNISVTPSTDIDINYSTTTIYVDNNSDGAIDKRIVPIQINVGTSTGSSTGTSTDVANLSTSSDPIGELFDIARARIRAYVGGGNVGSGGGGGIGGVSASTSSLQSTSSAPLATSSALFATSSTHLATSSVYLANKYIEKLDIAQRKYQKLGVLQSLTLLKSFYGSMESNMNTISNLILMYNKQQGFYSMNNFLSNNKKVLFLTGRQQEMREEILVYIEIHDAFSALTQGLGRGL